MVVAGYIDNPRAQVHMIRRDSSATPENSGRWILIPQIDHARLAGRLAEHWGAGLFAPLVPRDDLLWAVYHHDDGWREWDETPEVDPMRGRPRSFVEMALDDSLEIWDASIRSAERAGKLQGLVVAGHFCALLRRASAWNNDEPARPAVQRFLDNYESMMPSWQRSWQAENPLENTPERARQALAQLQFFDSLSLWFCCALASEPEMIETPGGPVLSITPLDPVHMVLEPWPLGVESLNLEVPGRSIPVGRYASRSEVAAAPSQSVLLRWHLQPLGAKS
ncbi:MAG: DUF3891 family protein [Planctomycetia bacterium]|nr:DUF3891 family protein [Planctomycetia bacterium]